MIIFCGRYKYILKEIRIIQINLGNIYSLLKKQHMNFEQLRASVEANKTVTESAITLLKGLAAQIIAANGQPAELNTIVSNLQTQTDALAAAIVSNTSEDTAPAE